jgi:hypothetical protein
MSDALERRLIADGGKVLEPQRLGFTAPINRSKTPKDGESAGGHGIEIAPDQHSWSPYFPDES